MQKNKSYYELAKSEMWLISLYNEYFLFDFFLDLVDDFDEIASYSPVDSVSLVIRNDLKKHGSNSLVKAVDLIHNFFPEEYISTISACAPTKFDVLTSLGDVNSLSYFLYLWLKINKSIRKKRLILVKKIKINNGPYEDTLALPIFFKNLQFFNDLIPISYDLYDWLNKLYISLRLMAPKGLLKNYFLGYFIYLFKFIKVGKFPKKSVLPDLYYHYKLRKLQKAMLVKKRKK
jgi:hypothetical protein